MSEPNFQFSSQFVQMYCHGVQLRCHDLNEILNTAEVDIKRLAHNQCFDLYEMQRIDKSIVSHFDNCHLMLFKDSPPSVALQLCADLLCHASTVHDALNKLIDFMRVINSPIQPSLQIQGDKAEISLSVCHKRALIDSQPLQFLVVLRLLKVIRIISQLGKDPIPLYAMKLAGAPCSIAEPYIKLHRPEFIYHRQKRNAFVIPSQCLAIACKADNAQFPDFLRQHSDIFLPAQANTTAQDSQEFELKLETWMMQQLDEKHRLPCAKSAAQHFGCNSKTISRHLQKSGMSFKEMKEKVINEKAVKLLLDTSLPASEIGRRLGFSNLSNFSRSFKEMNKLSPGEYRNGTKIRLN